MIRYHVERGYLRPPVLTQLVEEAERATGDPQPSLGHETGPTNRVADIRSFGAVARQLHRSRCRDLASRMTEDHLYPTRGVYINYDAGGFTAKHVDAGACDLTTIGQITESDTPLVLYSEDATVEPVEVHLLPGDLVIFRGSTTPHERRSAANSFLVAVWRFGSIAAQ